MERQDELKPVIIPSPDSIARKGSELHLNEILTDVKNERTVIGEEFKNSDEVPAPLPLVSF